MITKDGLDAVDLTEQRDVVGSAKKEDKQAKEQAEKLDLHNQAGTLARDRHDEAQDGASSENIHDAVISKYRGRGVFITSCILALVAAAVLLIDRSSLSKWWIVLVVASAAFLVFVQSKNISHSYVAEAQRIIQKEVSFSLRCALQTLGEGPPPLLTRALLTPSKYGC